MTFRSSRNCPTVSVSHLGFEATQYIDAVHYLNLLRIHRFEFKEEREQLDLMVDLAFLTNHSEFANRR